jgi:hypothetical protein
MVNHKLEADTSNMKWAGHLLDRLVAPECSSISECRAPEIPELPNYFGSFFLNNVFQGEVEDKTRSLILLFLRRLAQGVREYRFGREQFLRFVETLPRTNNVTGLYLRALSHFEQAVINTYLAVLAHAAIAGIIVPSSERPYKKSDGSPAQRLGAVYNALKHFDERIVRGTIPDIPAPVWIVNDGLKCADAEQGLGAIAKLDFTEMVTLFNELEADARFLSEDSYKIAAERRKENT